MYYLSVYLILLILLYLCLSTHTLVNSTEKHHGKSNKSGHAVKRPPKLSSLKITKDYFAAHESKEHRTETRLFEEMEYLDGDELREQYLLYKEFKKSPDCYIYLSTGGHYNMPIPSTTNRKNPTIIHPRKDGMLIFKHNQVVRLSCTYLTFVRPVLRAHDLLVKCINGSRVEFGGKPFEFETFICDTIPKPTLKLTELTCQNNTNNKFMEVGFQTTVSFLKLYRICFDAKNKRPVYSWYSAQGPKFMPYSILPIKPQFNFTDIFYDIDPDIQYETQKRTIESIIGSKSMASWYIRRDKKNRFLEPGHLVPQNAFPYPFEQYATFYHENTAPQWTLINRGIWRDVESVIKQTMFKSNHRHLILTGTYETMSLQDTKRKLYILYLSLPREMPVADYIWKMDYDVDEDKGVVFVGRNNLYEHDRSKITNTICPEIPCPGNITQLKSYSRDLLYCCDKETFEVTFGKFDPIVYEQFNNL